ncbi:MAG: hypothetical protein AVDCRST_MAG25-863 [uncultured Rubrobacteraceae bacterium]|uniref:VanZ-like domain-containing protein n=1 Tax=uncultured Rubrobacteraceae bacterium TaxID=349277 RepID=A0A6J4R135_9ACTN|nr:MAG: hypothetical protein AVDCRST_MAG25-863 [uncultured Rubrobacteraceae bacterium]
MPRTWVVALIVICIVLNGAGFLWHLFEPVPLYDEIAHLLTPLVLVAVVAEVIYRNGGDEEFFDTPRHAIVTGSAIGLLGAAGWEGVEVVLSAMGVAISNTLADSLFDVFLGVVGGAAGAYIADHFLDRLFGRSRTDSNRPRVR